MSEQDLGASAEPTGLSQVEPQEGLARSGFDPSRIAANRELTQYPARDVLRLAEYAAELGIVFKIDGFPFGLAKGSDK